MKSVPFLISTVLAFLAAILSVVCFTGGQGNNTMQGKLLEKQTTIQDLTTAVQSQNQEYQRQQQIIQAGADVDQKFGPPILRDMGYLAAKNKNEKLKILLVRYKFENFILTEDQLKEIDKQLEKNGTKPPTPAPATPASGTPSTPAPALRPPATPPPANP